MNIHKLKRSLELHEGLELKPYKCTAGYLTIGIGKNLDNGISTKQAYALLELDIEDCVKELDKAFPSWAKHNDERQNVLIELVFNMGMPRLKLFKKMFAALDKSDYPEAANQMLDSKWAQQVGKRAITLSMQMRTGVSV